MCNESCETECCGGKCSKKCCKICCVLSMIAISAIVSLFVVKFTAPCVVKHAMMKEFVEKQMDMMMMRGMMFKKHEAMKMMKPAKPHHEGK